MARPVLRPPVVLAGVIVLALAVILAFGVFGPTGSSYPQGDHLGPDPAESSAEYEQRAQSSLEAAQEPAFAMVIFDRPLDPERAAAVVEPLERVSAAVISQAAPVALPEPTPGDSRAQVFTVALDRLQASVEGIGHVQVPRELDAVIVYSAGDALRQVAQDPAVASIEVLPADAAWGGFAVRPPAAHPSLMEQS